MRIEELLLNSNYAKPSFYIIDDHDEWRFQALQKRVSALAGALKSQGVGPADRMALISENGASFLVGLLGILAAGAIAVPMDPQIPVSNVIERGFQCSIKGLCISGARPEKNFPGRDGLPVDWLFFSEKNGDWGDETVGGQAVPLAPGGTDQDAALILFSSGTTGTPKGVVLTHRAIVENMAAITGYMNPGPSDLFYIIKTMVHVSTLTGELLTGLGAGAGIIARNPLVPPPVILKRIESMRPTIFFTNPSLLRILLKVNRESLDLSSLRLVYTSGAVAERELILETRGLFPQAAVLNVYGLTEAGPRVTAQGIPGAKNKPGSVGKAIGNVIVAVRNPEGQTCQTGETGRIYVNSPSLMLGYWNDPESTRQKIMEGWLDTGDLGYLDEDGELFVVGRADEVIIRGSHNIDPYRVENVIRQFPGVANCIAFGVPDSLDGHRLVCSIQKEPGCHPEHSKIMAHCRESLAPYECPQVICQWDELPLTPSGKPSRKLAKDRYLASQGLREKTI